MKLIAYTRVSTDQQGDSGLGLASQRDAIERHCHTHSHTLLHVHEDIDSGAKHDRQGFQLAMSTLQHGNAHGLIVAKLDRLTRSLAHFAQIMETSRRQGWALIALDLGVDTTTPAGEMMASVLASFAQYERRLIGERTKAALAQKRARLGGKLPGTRPSLSHALRGRIRKMRAEGMTMRAICEQLTLEGVATAQGGAWSTSTVAWVLAH